MTPAQIESVKDLCRTAAWKEPTTTCGHSDCPHQEHAGEPNLLIHCYAGGLGADWALANVLQAIDDADEIVWRRGFADHDLRVLVAGRWRTFQVPQPRAEELAVQS